jgi:hypothetical protein
MINYYSKIENKEIYFMKLKNIISCFFLLTALVLNILSIDEDIGLEVKEEINSLIMEENWIPTDENLGFFEARENKYAKWDNEYDFDALPKVCDKLSSDQYTSLTITGKINYMNYMGDDLKKISELNLRNLKILDLDLYYPAFSGEELYKSQKYIEELFKNNHELTVVFRKGEEISKVFTIN